MKKIKIKASELSTSSNLENEFEIELATTASYKVVLLAYFLKKG